MNTVSIDFEYTNGHLAHPTLVCACLKVNENETEHYWLYDNSDRQALIDRVNELKKDSFFISHAVEKAEGMCFIQLGIKDTSIRWWDTMMVEHLIHNKARMSKTFKLGLVDTLNRYKLLVEDADDVKAHKDEMRRIIIEQDNIEGHKKEILEYCSSDIHLLRQLWYRQYLELSKLTKIDEGLIVKIPFGRNFDITPVNIGFAISSTAWKFALIDSNGIPLKKDEVSKFLNGSRNGRFLLHRNFNLETYDIFEIKVSRNMAKSTMKFAKVQRFIKDIIDENNITDWPLSEKTKAYSLKEEVLKNYEHLDERLSKFRQMRKIDKMLSSFTKQGEKNWLSTYDENEGRVYSYHGYGLTQTYRNTAKPSSGFVPLWSKSMRTLMYPPKGKVLIAVDYSSEEFILGMDIYNDGAGVDSYKTGDVYIASGVKMGLLPNGVKKSDILPSGERVKDIRQRVKGLVLGLGYGMGFNSLSRRLDVDPLDAKELMTQYKEIYYRTFDKQEDLKNELKLNDLLFQLPNGYMLLARGKTEIEKEDGTFIDATLSSINWIVQASGAYILQSIVNRCLEHGLKIITTIHDEVVIEADDDKAEESAKLLSKIMIDAYEELTGTRNVRVGEPEIWGDLNGNRCDHNEDGCKAYYELLELVSQSTNPNVISQVDRECYADEFDGQ